MLAVPDVWLSVTLVSSESSPLMSKVEVLSMATSWLEGVPVKVMFPSSESFTLTLTVPGPSLVSTTVSLPSVPCAVRV